MLGVTIGQRLQDKAETTPDKEALVLCLQNERRTFSQLLNEVDKFAAGLLELGIQRGDRVGIWGPNSLEWILTQYATARIGAILVNINPLYRQYELEYALRKVGCKALVAAEGFKDLDYYNLIFHLVPELATHKPGAIKSHLLPDLKTIIMMGEKSHPGTFRFCDILEAGTSKQRAEIMDLQDKLQFDDPINIQFTSGTTGSPKGATLTHHNILNNSYFMGFRLNLHTLDARLCVPLPLYHCSGMVVGSLTMLTHGSTCVLPSPWYDATLTLEAVSKERCTTLGGVPTMFIDMLNHPNLESFDLSSLRSGLMGGAPCPMETMRQVMEKMNITHAMILYGSTETSPCTHQTMFDHPIEKRVSSVGVTHEHVETKIVDEDGNVVPVNTAGEMCTRGYTTMLYYWDDPDRTRDTITADRWYHSGDMATMDEDGFCQIVGRIKDMIIRGGENIYPTEIEQVLYTHPDIKDIQIVGVPDERLGEEVYAFVQLKDGHAATGEDIKQFCREKKNPGDHRKKWDKDEYERIAQERLEEEQRKLLEKELKEPPTKRSLLQPRDYKVDLDSKLGRSQVITKTTPSSQQGGYYCNVCDCVVKDSINFLDHINGKKHQRNLGMSMKIERSTLDQVKKRFEMNKKKMDDKKKDYDFEERLKELKEEEEKQKAYKREKRKDRKRKHDTDGGESQDSDMAALMGFSGFGSSKK
ncbi:hypothetical protein FSP39_009474 [Pinctada imbricata]|uniref:Medium-chain acyl-CoA ligase ACSF2, mitochondrial n=1 Tax=Pinctada imbricata TaxID=66713 RepID=A0AA88YI13_PINIB|nr:hypothetical protein FSP39_009474 [Pinctada imbricata]